MDVHALPRRVAHAVHALIESSRAHNMPVTASEVMLYDEEALDPRSTGSALVRARDRHRLAVNAGRLWVPTGLALDHRSAFEDRFLADVGSE